MAVNPFDPAGANGVTPLTSDTPLDQVQIAQGGSVKYNTLAGMSRGNEVGLEFLAPLAPDQAYVGMPALVLTNAAARARAYVIWEEWPHGNALVEFLRLRAGTVGTGTNIIRLLLATDDHTTYPPGTVVCQGFAGVNINVGATGSPILFTAVLGEPNRYEVAAQPATATTGLGDAQVYDDTGTIIASLGHAAADLNMGTAVPTRMAVGKVGTLGTNLKMYATQLAIDTAATMPSIPGVPKNVATVTPGGSYERVWTGTSWVSG